MSSSRGVIDLRVESLFDPMLQVELSGEEFRAFINVLILAAHVNDGGQLTRGEALLVPGVTPEVLETLARQGLVDVDSNVSVSGHLATIYEDDL